MIKNEHLEMFTFMHDYTLKGIGPSEVSLYVLVDSVFLGGGNSAGLDVIDSVTGREVKAAKITEDGYARDFKVGGTVNLAPIVTNLCTLKEKCGIFEGEGVSSNIIKHIANERPNEFKKITSDFREVVTPYFCDHEIVFINHNSSLKTRGRIEKIVIPDPNDIEIHCVTSNTVKPRIKIHGID